MSNILYSYAKKELQRDIKILLAALLCLLVNSFFFEGLNSILIILSVFGLVLLVQLKFFPAWQKPLIKITDKSLVWRQSNYIPTKVQEIEFGLLKKVEVVGPKADRRFRFICANDHQEEIRPFLNSRQYVQTMSFLKESLPKNIQLIELESPSIFSQIRGDF